MLERWFLHIPTEPLADLRRAAEDTGSRMADTITPPRRWNLLQAAFSWGDKHVTKPVVEELVLMGVDINTRVMCGLNALHMIILLLFARRDVGYDSGMLEWWISKGADVAVMAVIYDIQQRRYRVLSPLDMVLALYARDLVVFLPDYLPACTRYAPANPTRKKSVYKQEVKKLIWLLLCGGATTSIKTRELDEVRAAMSAHKLPSYPFLTDYLKTRLKFPESLTATEVRRRIHYLRVFSSFPVDVSGIADLRRDRFLSGREEDYYNPEFEEAGEFMPYEYMGYKDSQGRTFHFHKSMVPAMFRTATNPFTREPIPQETLRGWLDRMNGFPRAFLLRDSLTDHGLLLWDATATATATATRHGFDFLYEVLSPHFPYTNVAHVQSLSIKEVAYLCSVLSGEPYSLTGFGRYEGAPDVVDFFQQTAFGHLMNPRSALEVFHFGLEDAYQDIRCYHLIKKVMPEVVSFRDSFLVVVTIAPEVGDVIRDRVGYVHLGYFHEIWRRVATIHEKFS